MFKKAIILSSFILAVVAMAMAQRQDAGQQRERTIPMRYENTVCPREVVRKAASGIIVVGGGDTVRAMSTFSSSEQAREAYAMIANKYYDTFNGRVNVYCMPIPLASAFYTPDTAQSWTRDQRAALIDIFSHLKPGVKAVDAYTTLGAHAAEDIYLRTDHHWAPKGAFYVARHFAQVAGVPFRNLSFYEERIVKDFVGTMYKFSKDASVKRAPEDFVYYVPTAVRYSTTRITYTLGRGNHVAKTSEPVESEFFREYKDGSGGAYSTFMGGDTNTTHVHTTTRNGRRLLILKDSFGNAIPGYLFYSFEDIHVVDCRYFTFNIVDYVNNNEITDILFCNNITHACTDATVRAYERYLTQ